ncbi:MAG TPA: tRNA pseudouridine(38-40) synthase TruA [Actinomycetota bacterium]|jgi:tRNA pseudouridine38-40 synthase|nr:tRNA pseudouridine(38-40) synthase TruA [Actinomycetota bacterium]
MTECATRRLRLVVAYDGSPFSGFARQRDRRTVQGDLEAALARMAGRPVTVVCAGRTDAGVHARGQVVHADVPARLEPERVRRVLNAVLGPAIVMREAAWAPEEFDARFSARRRTYVYRVDDSGGPDPLCRGFVLRWPRRLDLDGMRAAAEPLVGEHDFAAFCRQRAGSSTRRRLRSIRMRRVRGLVEIRLVADAFCWQMVRGIVGHLLAVGDGRRDPASTTAVLASRDRAAAGILAPPHALVLESVTYPATGRGSPPAQSSAGRAGVGSRRSRGKLTGSAGDR